jgi:hypothetical protein
LRRDRRYQQFGEGGPTMTSEDAGGKGLNRRRFLTHASLGTAAVAAAAGAPSRGQAATPVLPSVKLGDRTISRLIAGYNPIGGHSHLNPTYSIEMREYFTVERTVEFLNRCEALGITAFQLDMTDKIKEVVAILRDQGSKLALICLHAGRPSDAAFGDLFKYGLLGIAHHGGVTDARFRAGKMEEVHDFVKKVHDGGCLAAVSSHSPVNIMKMEDAGWETDFYMTCFHYVTRTRDEMRKELGFVTIGEPFIESDPDRMTAVIRQVDKPCLAFKILAAGRRCSSQGAVAAAFKYAFGNIKKTDAVIVGMYPRYQDEVALNVEHMRKYAGV